MHDKGKEAVKSRKGKQSRSSSRMLVDGKVNAVKKKEGLQ